MLYIMASFKKEISYLLDLVKIVKKTRSKKKLYYKCNLHDKDFYIIKTGLGEKSVNFDPDFFENCDFIVSTGFCGALTDEMKNGDIIIADHIITVEKENYDSIIYGKNIESLRIYTEKIEFDKLFIDKFIEKLANDKLTVLVAQTFTSPKIVRNKAQKIAINKSTGAKAVDMEDIYRLKFARKLGVNFLSIRVVLDEIADDIPGFADGFKMGQKLTGIISKMDRASQSIAVAIDKFVELL